MNGLRSTGGNGARIISNGSRPRTPAQEKATFKIVILGSPGVGKTALTVRFITKRFIGEYCPTLESIHKIQTYVDNDDVRMEILDTAGMMDDSGSSTVTWKDYYAFWGDCYIYVYAINDRNSFEEIVNVKRRVDFVRRNTTCGILVGNKADLLHDRQISEEEAGELADEIGCKFYEVSAADWTNIAAIVDMFCDAVRAIRRTRNSRDIRSRRQSSSTRFRQVIQKVITGKGGVSKKTGAS